MKAVFDILPFAQWPQTELPADAEPPAVPCPEHLRESIYEKLGIPSDLIAQAPDGRPVRLVEGHPIKEWM